MVILELSTCFTYWTLYSKELDAVCWDKQVTLSLLLVTIKK